MPISEYFKGSGEKVMSSMKKQYGDKKGESVFYATANKNKDKKKKKSATGPTDDGTKWWMRGEEKEKRRLKPPKNVTGVRG